MSKLQPVTTLTDQQPIPSDLLERRMHRSFDLHPALFAMTVGGYLAYLGVMAGAFMVPELMIPFAIFVVTIVAAFAVPAMWARTEGARVGRMPDWARFMRDGIDTGSGHLSGSSAVAQVMIMPAMLLSWGLIIALIRAAV